VLRRQCQVSVCQLHTEFAKTLHSFQLGNNKGCFLIFLVNNNHQFVFIMLLLHVRSLLINDSCYWIALITWSLGYVNSLSAWADIVNINELGWLTGSESEACPAVSSVGLAKWPRIFWFLVKILGYRSAIKKLCHTSQWVLNEYISTLYALATALSGSVLVTISAECSLLCISQLLCVSFQILNSRIAFENDKWEGECFSEFRTGLWCRYTIRLAGII